MKNLTSFGWRVGDPYLAAAARRVDRLPGAPYLRCWQLWVRARAPVFAPGFVSGHDFSRAAMAPTARGISPFALCSHHTNPYTKKKMSSGAEFAAPRATNAVEGPAVPVLPSLTRCGARAKAPAFVLLTPGSHPPTPVPSNHPLCELHQSHHRPNPPVTTITSPSHPNLPLSPQSGSFRLGPPSPGELTAGRMTQIPLARFGGRRVFV
jgi:hypothetical protein